MEMTGSPMQFIVTNNQSIANELILQGYTLLNSKNEQFVFIYDELISIKFSLPDKCYITNTLLF